MYNEKLNESKVLICDLTMKLFEVNNLEGKHIEDCVFQVMNSLGTINEAEDLDLIHTFVDNCNRADINILIIEELFEQTFNPQPQDDLFASLGKILQPKEIIHA